MFSQKTVQVLAIVLLLIHGALCRESVTLIYADAQPIDGRPSAVFAETFREKLEHLSGGRLKVELCGGGILGMESQMIGAVCQGTAEFDLGRVSASAFLSDGCEGARIWTVPYAFGSHGHFERFSASVLSSMLLDEPHTQGLPMRGIAFGEEGFRHFFFREPVDGIADLAGKRIRVYRGSDITPIVHDLGGEPVALDFAQLYMSLMTGEVDGAEQTLYKYRENGLAEVAPHVVLDGHLISAYQLIITDDAWGRLSERERTWVLEAGQAASAASARAAADAENGARTELEKQGITVLEVSDKSLWRRACGRSVSEAAEGIEALCAQLETMASQE